MRGGGRRAWGVRMAKGLRHEKALYWGPSKDVGWMATGFSGGRGAGGFAAGRRGEV